MEKIGHRGAKGYVAENTLASIDHALDLGVDAIEIDIHVCKTGELFVIHDEKMNRTTTGEGKIRKLTYRQIKKENSDGFAVPTLQEVLEHCKGKCKIHIELKGRGTAIKGAALIAKEVEVGNWSYNQLVVSSFKSSRLDKIRQYNPNILLGLITAKKPCKALRNAVKKGYGSVYIYHKKLKPHMVRIAKLKKIKVYTWTVNEPEFISKMSKLEIQGIISDFPDQI